MPDYKKPGHNAFIYFKIRLVHIHLNEIKYCLIYSLLRVFGIHGLKFFSLRALYVYFFLNLHRYCNIIMKATTDEHNRRVHIIIVLDAY